MPTFSSPPVALAPLEGNVSGDVAMDTAGTFYGGPSVTLTPGTWFLVGTVTFLSGATNGRMIAKLWDGTTVESSAETIPRAAAEYATITLSGIVTVTTSTAWKIDVTSTVNTQTLKAATGDSGSGNHASHLRAFRIYS